MLNIACHLLSTGPRGRDKGEDHHLLRGRLVVSRVHESQRTRSELGDQEDQRINGSLGD